MSTLANISSFDSSAATPAMELPCTHTAVAGNGRSTVTSQALAARCMR
jgi:hypothetical protein